MFRRFVNVQYSAPARSSTLKEKKSIRPALGNRDFPEHNGIANAFYRLRPDSVESLCPHRQCGLSPDHQHCWGRSTFLRAWKGWGASMDR